MSDTYCDASSTQETSDVVRKLFFRYFSFTLDVHNGNASSPTPAHASGPRSSQLGTGVLVKIPSRSPRAERPED